MKMLSLCKDTDLLILNKLSYNDLFNIFQTNTYLSKLSNDENLWRNKLWKDYNKIYPDEKQTWKELYLKLQYYISKYGYRKDIGSFMASKINGHNEVTKYLISFKKHETDKPFKCLYIIQRGANADQKCLYNVSYDKNKKGSHKFCDNCLKKHAVQKLLGYL